VPEIEPGNSCTESECVTTAPASQLRVSIVVKLFNCFDDMGRNVNTQSRICGPHILISDIKQKKTSLTDMVAS